MKQVYKIGSLFAGVGGICLGFKQATFENKEYELAWANEIDEYACETYRTNFEHKLIQGDINKVLNPNLIDIEIEDLNKKICKETDDKTISRFKSEISMLEDQKHYYELQREKILKYKTDVLNGGFPCQAFSIAGERKGFDDERGNLFWSIIRLIKDLDKIHGKLRILFLENVKNLKSHDNGNTYKVIKSELEKVGYIIKEEVLNTMDYSDLPQNRESIYIVGFLNEQDAHKFDLFDRIKNLKIKKSSNERMEDTKKVIDYSITSKDYEKYYYTRKKYPHYFITEEEYNQIPPEVRKEERVNLEEQINEMYQFYQVRRGMYVRKNMSAVCPTLTANMGTGGHNVPLIKVNDGIRKITPKETFKLQGFPIGQGYELPKKYNGRSYSDAQLYKQAGNAVSVPIIKFLAIEELELAFRKAVAKSS